MVAIMVAFSRRVITHSSIALVVAMRSGWPFRHPSPKNDRGCDYRFLALLGNDREFDLAVLDVKNRVRDLSLRKNNLILPIVGYRFSLAHLGEKYFGIKRGFNSLPHKGSLFLSHKGGPFPRQRQGEAVGLLANSNAKMNAYHAASYEIRVEHLFRQRGAPDRR